MKLLLCVLDGLSDRPCPQLNEKTPLEAAKTPNMDKLAKKSLLGKRKVLDIAPESDSAVMVMLGYDVKEIPRRGALEALGANRPFKSGYDIAFRCNFATSDKKGEKIVDRRCGRNLTEKEAKSLEREINENIKPLESKYGLKIIFKATTEHRGVLLIKSKKKGKFSKMVGGTDPAYITGPSGIPEAIEKPKMVYKKPKAIENTKEAKFTAKILDEITKEIHKILEKSKINQKRRKDGKLPANFLLSRDPEVELPKIETMKERWGKRWIVLADMPLEIGIGRLVGMDYKKLPKPREGAEAYRIRARMVSDVIKKYDCVYVHLKGPDVFGHDGDAIGKMKNIEEIDRYFFGNLNLEGVMLVITADHTTPCTIKAHSSDPVPVLIYNSGKIDGADKFDEKNCEKRKINKKIDGIKFMEFIMKLSK